MRRICSLNSSMWLGTLVLEHQHQLNYLHISAALSQMAQLHACEDKISSEDEGDAAEATSMLIGLAQERVIQLRPREISNILWAVAKLHRVGHFQLGQVPARQSCFHYKDFPKTCFSAHPLRSLNVLREPWDGCIHVTFYIHAG